MFKDSTAMPSPAINNKAYIHKHTHIIYTDYCMFGVGDGDEARERERIENVHI
jgi:hypothetical protein